MSQKSKANLLPALFIVTAVVVVVAVASMYAFSQPDETIQGQADVTEYRVSSKVPGRILEIKVKEGQMVHVGDTLVLLEAPDVEAKLSQAEAAEAAAAAQSRKAEKGARQELIRGAYEMWQKAKAGEKIAEKSYARVKRLYDQGVVNGAEREDKEAAAAVVRRAKGAVSEVNSYIKETVLLATHDGEVTEIFPQVGELVGTGAPIMNVAMMDDLWVTFNIREDHLEHFGMGQTFEAVIPALGNKSVKLKVYYLKDLGSYAAWKATKTTGQFDMKTFEVKASLEKPVKGLRPGMSVLVK